MATSTQVRKETIVGICRCGNPAEPGKKSCYTCLKKSRDNARRRKEMGLCQQCSNKARDGKYLCQECADKRRNLVRKQRENGMCIKPYCKNKAIPGETRCEEHKSARNKYNKKIRKERAVAGVCTECGRDHSEDTALCASCKEKALKMVQKRSFGGMRDTIVKRDGGLCRLCGREGKVVHHKDNSGLDGPNKDAAANNAEDNLILLCRRCHNDIHRLGNRSTRVAASILVTNTGERNDTRSRPVMTGWLGKRKEILERDGFTCVLCGDRESALVVHHKDDRGLRTEAPNNSNRNLVTLCKPCHNAVTHLRNNASRQLASLLLRQMGPGALGRPAS